MKCIKTGFTLYIESNDTHTRVDLFIEGKDLYVNKNSTYKGRPTHVDGTCSAIEVGGRHDRLQHPRIDPSIVEYVKTSPFNGFEEEQFLSLFG